MGHKDRDGEDSQKLMDKEALLLMGKIRAARARVKEAYENFVVQKHEDRRKEFLEAEKTLDDAIRVAKVYIERRKKELHRTSN